MTDLHFPAGLVDGAWARGVRLTVGGDGLLHAVRVDAEPDGAERVEGVVVPGVPDVHSHAFQRALAGLTERAGEAGGDTFWSWRERMYAFLERLDPDDVEAVAEQLFIELLRHGFTAVAEFHYLRNDPAGRPYADPVEMGRRVVAAAERAGIALTLLPALYCAGDFGGGPPSPGQRRFLATPEELVGDIEALAAVAGGRNEVRVGLALHSLRAVPPEALREALGAARALDERLPVHIHVAEQAREVEACLAWSGARPVEWLLDNAPVNPAWCLIHATHVTPSEVRGMAASGAVVGLCPTTEANLGDGVFPLQALASAGGAWGVGTDSHVSTSPVAELRTLEYGQRLTHQARNVAAPPGGSTGRALLDAAWEGGARACGRRCGRVAPGYAADLVVLGPEHPALAGRHGDALLDSWIFSGEESPVRDVFVGGRRVVRDGRHERAEAAAAAYGAVARRLAGLP